MSQNTDNLKEIIEALLFASERPLTLDQIKKACECQDTEAIRSAIKALTAEYQDQSRGIMVREVAEGFQMTSSASYSSFIKKLFKGPQGDKLSKPALETLAIIAYKQPVTKLEIESLRRVNIDGVMANLLEKNLIRIAGRRKAPGRPKVYGTTRQFLEHFGLKSLDELPKIKDLPAPENQEQVEFKNENELLPKEEEQIDENKQPAQEN